MRGIICLLAFCLADATALAQPVDRLKASTGRSAEDMKDIKERIAFWLKTCLSDWDAATHMSKGEWRTTCNRVATERGAFMLEGPDSFSVKGKSGPR
jgi:hypothetical protein